ncbi:MAG TPA: hypothetical protein VJN93_09670 [Candidatus Acidoferrum sp.]|nr:hypothetical protein [Candidatus Acidoferrum sp.]
MRRVIAISCAALGFVLAAPAGLNAQSSGVLDINAHVTPTSARPEPVREFTLYVLTKSYADIVKEVIASDEVPSRKKFIDSLTVSPELKKWLKSHDVLDLALPDLDKQISPDDIIEIPEFLAAYQRSNSGGVTSGLPKPKYHETDKDAHPEKYEKERQEYLAALKKFVQKNPATVSGIELELYSINPESKWATLVSNQKKRVQRLAPDVAQTKYLAGKADTDLEGHALIGNLPPGKYWVSSLNLDASAGDVHVRWDVPITIEPGQTARIELSNLNSTDTLAALAP